MKFGCKFQGLLITLLLIFLGAAPIQRSQAKNSAVQGLSNDQTAALNKREQAYRANNLGVALLEQYKAKEAAQSFTMALEIKPDLLKRNNKLIDEAKRR